MARIAGIDLPKNKRGCIGLTYIYGIGRTRSINVETSQAQRARADCLQVDVNGLAIASTDLNFQGASICAENLGAVEIGLAIAIGGAVVAVAANCR